MILIKTIKTKNVMGDRVEQKPISKNVRPKKEPCDSYLINWDIYNQFNGIKKNPPVKGKTFDIEAFQDEMNSYDHCN